MNKSKATVSVFLDTRRALTDGKYPVALRVSYRSAQWSVSLRMYATKQDFSKAMQSKGKLSSGQLQLREEVIEKKQKAETVISNLTSVTRDSFKKYFLSEIDVSMHAHADVKSQFEAYAAQLRDEDRIRSADWYLAALKSFLSFRSNCDLSQVDEEYLRKYDAFMLKKGCSRSTVKMYMEAMRRILNVAIKKGILHEKHYPFKEFTIGRSVKSKKALYPHQVKLLWDAPAMNDTQRLAKDMWFLSYLCHGANNTDLMRLKWKDISNGRITFTRSKTSRTAKTSIPIVVHMHEEARAIIERHGNEKRGTGDWVFPVLNGCATEAEIVKKVRDWRRHVNRCLNRMGKRLGLDFLLSLSIARHSFATALKLKGTPTGVISEMLGHTSTQTTEHYLGSIPDDMRKGITASLLDFGTLKAV